MRKTVILFSAMVLSMFMLSPVFAQHRGHGHQAPPPPQRGEHERERAEPRRQSPPPREHAVPRTRPIPRPHPEYGQYYRGYHNGQYYFWRPYPRIWIRPNTCVAGYWDWDWDPVYNEWVPVWIQGYCNVPRYRPGARFYFWFDFRR